MTLDRYLEWINIHPVGSVSHVSMFFPDYQRQTWQRLFSFGNQKCITYWRLNKLAKLSLGPINYSSTDNWAKIYFGKILKGHKSLGSLLKGIDMGIRGIDW